MTLSKELIQQIIFYRGAVQIYVKCELLRKTPDNFLIVKKERIRVHLKFDKFGTLMHYHCQVVSNQSSTSCSCLVPFSHSLCCLAYFAEKSTEILI